MNKIDLAKDIIATASILIKYERDDILSNQSLFIEFLNELGFRTVTGKEFTKMGFRNMFLRMSEKDRREVLSEFMEDQRGTQLLSTMMLNGHDNKIVSA